MIEGRTVLVLELADRMRAMLAGLGPDVQSAVLADLFATWLAGWQGAEKDAVREEALALWLQTVRNLVPVNEARMLEELQQKGRRNGH